MLRRRICHLAAAALCVAGLVGVAVPAHADWTHGSISGSVTTAEGRPIADVHVTVHSADNTNTRRNAQTGADGTFSVPDVDPGDYKFEFYFTEFQPQWAYNADSFETATTFTVVVGQNTVVNEKLRPMGTLSVTAVDATTGAGLNKFCIAAAGEVGRYACTENGVAVARDVPPGEYSIDVRAEEGVYFEEQVRAVARPDTTTDVVAKLAPGATVTTTIRDKATGAPISRACLALSRPDAGGLSPSEAGWCSDSTGKITASPVRAGNYQVFVVPGGAYGAQWVGWTGGTGDRDKARQMTVAVGRDNTIAPIRVDKAGTITGTVTDKDTGEPVPGICAYPHAATAGAGGGGPEDGRCTDATGRYTLRGLGPYTWPVIFTDATGGYGWQWSGGAAHRKAATPVKVTVGGNAKADAKLVKAAKVTGKITIVGGDPDVQGTALAYSAVTGDIAGPYAPTGDYENGVYVLGGLASQEVKIAFDASTAGYLDSWYRDADSFRKATPVRVRAGTTTSGIDGTVRRAG